MQYNVLPKKCPEDKIWLPYFVRTKYVSHNLSSGHFMAAIYSVLVCHTSSGQNAAAIFCPDKIRQPYFVRTKINITAVFCPNIIIMLFYNNYYS